MKTQISVFDKIKYTTIIIFKIYILVFILLLISELIDALVLSVDFSKMSNVILIIVFTYSIISLIFTCDLNFYFLIFYSILVLAVNYLFNEKKVKLYSINLIITPVIFGLFM
jgi:hypothetical protein